MRISDWSSDVCSSDLCIHSSYFGHGGSQIRQFYVVSSRSNHLIAKKAQPFDSMGEANNHDLELSKDNQIYTMKQGLCNFTCNVEQDNADRKDLYPGSTCRVDRCPCAHRNRPDRT